MTLLQPQCCPWWWVGECRGVPPEIYYHLHCFESVELQVVVTAPDSQLLNLLSVSRLVSVLDEADDCSVICKLQELDRGVFRCAVICVEGEEQWGREHIPEGRQCWWWESWMWVERKKAYTDKTKLNPAARDDTLRSKDTKRSVCARNWTVFI